MLRRRVESPPRRFDPGRDRRLGAAVPADEHRPPRVLAPAAPEAAAARPVRRAAVRDAVPPRVRLALHAGDAPREADEGRGHPRGQRTSTSVSASTAATAAVPNGATREDRRGGAAASRYGCRTSEIGWCGRGDPGSTLAPLPIRSHAGRGGRADLTRARRRYNGRALALVAELVDARLRAVGPYGRGGSSRSPAHSSTARASGAHRRS